MQPLSHLWLPHHPPPHAHRRLAQAEARPAAPHLLAVVLGGPGDAAAAGLGQ